MACIFSGNEIYLTEDADGPVGHIFQVADRGCDNIEVSGHSCGEELNIWFAVPAIIINGRGKCISFVAIKDKSF